MTRLAPYGYCPECGQPGTQRARDMIGTTRCAAGHEWVPIQGQRILRERAERERVPQGILPDHEVARLCEGEGMITPYVPQQVRYINGVSRRPAGTLPAPGIDERVVSYGQGSYGYDIRASNEWLVFDPIGGSVVDPKALNEKIHRDIHVPDGEAILLPPNSYALTVSVERFRMPEDVVGICVGKSTYARCGIIVNVTPLEPGWTGHLTIEISNATPLPARVYAGEGIAQVQFWRGDAPRVHYGNRPGGAGKYQGQEAHPTPARM